MPTELIRHSSPQQNPCQCLRRVEQHERDETWQLLGRAPTHAEFATFATEAAGPACDISCIAAQLLWVFVPTTAQDEELADH